jgi:hypothetical protein
MASLAAWHADPGDNRRRGDLKPTEHHVPVVWHHAIAADPHPSDPQRLGDRRDEALVVGGTLEDRPPANGTVQDVKIAGGDTMQA